MDKEEVDQLARCNKKVRMLDVESSQRKERDVRDIKSSHARRKVSFRDVVMENFGPGPNEKDHSSTDLIDAPDDELENGDEEGQPSLFQWRRNVD
ncbi:hypothetical protein PTKIN_Ptkin06aG0056000 [Pterospermum kingtungense]